MNASNASATVIPILLYHSISAEPAGWIAPYAVTPTTFAQHVELICNSLKQKLTDHAPTTTRLKQSEKMARVYP